jgi:hypothetical protein
MATRQLPITHDFQLNFAVEAAFARGADRLITAADSTNRRCFKQRHKINTFVDSDPAAIGPR